MDSKYIVLICFVISYLFFWFKPEHGIDVIITGVIWVTSFIAGYNFKQYQVEKKSKKVV